MHMLYDSDSFVVVHMLPDAIAEARRDICTLKDDIFGFGSCFA